MALFVRGSTTKTALVFPLSKILKTPAVSSVRRQSSSKCQYVMAEKVGKKCNVGLIQFNRPKVFNVFCDRMVTELVESIAAYDADDAVGAIVVTGSVRVFSAGADIKEMFDNTYSTNLKIGIIQQLDNLNKCRKPIIAAVNGLTLGIGCELAMMCDVIYAGEDAVLGQTEVRVGTLPGAGASQRMIRSCGKSFTMEAFLTGNKFTAREALSRGLVSKVFPPEQLVNEAIALAEQISRHSRLIVTLCKESVNYAYESNLSPGLQFEKKNCFIVRSQPAIEKKRNDRVL